MKKDFNPNIEKGLSLARSRDKKIQFENYLDLCKGCGLCIEYCPQKCLSFHKKNTGVYGQPAISCDITKCTYCLICERICPDGAILLKKLDK